MTVKYLSFEITGEFITQHARDLIQENKVREAERFLLTSIVGLSHGQMINILRGEKKMIGSSRGGTLDLDDDDPTVRPCICPNGRAIKKVGKLILDVSLCVMFSI